MDIDRLARTTHRRGLLAGLVSLIAAPAIAGRAQAVTCSARGQGCTLLNPCCPGLRCYATTLYNPNSGICGRHGNTSTSSSPVPPRNTSDGDDGYLSKAELIERYDVNGDNELDCEIDFANNQPRAQEAYNANPNDPFGLDGPVGSGREGTGEYGVPCEDQA